MKKVMRFIEMQDEPHHALLLKLHEWLMSFPAMHCELRYGVPFYGRNRWVCYLNPLKKRGLECCFLYAYVLADERGVLDFRGRTQVAGMILSSIYELDFPALRAVLQEALLIDDLPLSVLTA